jgi:hypothetical protein
MARTLSISRVRSRHRSFPHLLIFVLLAVIPAPLFCHSGPSPCHPELVEGLRINSGGNPVLLSLSHLQSIRHWALGIRHQEDHFFFTSSRLFNAVIPGLTRNPVLVAASQLPNFVPFPIFATSHLRVLTRLTVL